MKTITIHTLMQDSGVAFGTSGARGLVSQMSDEVCAAYTLAFLASQNLSHTGVQVALGMDLRPSSPRIVAACAAAIRQAGCIPRFCGMLPTPALALFALEQQIPAIMVTGSHIPFDRNGIKFYRADGEISKADETAITAAVVDLAALPSSPALPDADPSALDRYLTRYQQLFPADLLSGWRIGVYQHSSAARDFLPVLLSNLGAEVIGLERSDNFVPIDTEAVSEADYQRGQAWATAFKLNAIVSTDGDADRPLIADETGHWLRGDIVGLLCAEFVGAHTVVTPVSCNTAIEACGLFKQVCRTRIGSPYVIAQMQQVQGPVAGFEANGGFLAGPGLQINAQALTALPTRDAVLPMVAIMAMARQQGKAISALLTDLPQRFTASDRLQHFATHLSQSLLAALQTDANACQTLFGKEMGAIVHQDLTDGLRLSFSNGEIIHLRPSGNAPELRCYAEANSTIRASQLVQNCLQKLAASVA